MFICRIFSDEQCTHPLYKFEINFLIIYGLQFYYVGRKLVSFITCFQPALSENKFYLEFRPLYRVYVLSWIEQIFYIQDTNALFGSIITVFIWCNVNCVKVQTVFDVFNDFVSSVLHSALCCLLQASQEYIKLLLWLFAHLNQASGMILQAQTWGLQITLLYLDSNQRQTSRPNFAERKLHFSLHFMLLPSYKQINNSKQ